MSVSKTYTQVGEPSGAALFDFWINPETGIERVKLASGWGFSRDLNLPLGGGLPREGGVALGAIEGAHGHAMNDNPRMTGVAKVNDETVVTEEQLDALTRSISERMLLYGQQKNVAQRSELIMSMDQRRVVGDAQSATFERPVFSDGSRATMKQIKWTPFIACIANGLMAEGVPADNHMTWNGSYAFGCYLKVVDSADDPIVQVFTRNATTMRPSVVVGAIIIAQR